MSMRRQSDLDALISPRRQNCRLWPIVFLACITASLFLDVRSKQNRASFRAATMNNNHDHAQIQTNFVLHLEAGDCGIDLSGSYRMADAIFENETVASPGCSIFVRSHNNNITTWNLIRKWSGAGLLPSFSAAHQTPRASLARIDPQSAFTTFWEPGLYEISATNANGDLRVAYVRCIYIRHEVRDLSPADRMRWLTATKILESLDGDTGRQKFGSAFSSVAELAGRHIKAAAHRTSDRIHDGLGFLPQHIALTNEYEKSLQAVDPTVALPYWDVTRDLVTLGSDEDVTKRQSPLAASTTLLLANPELWSSEAGVFGRLPKVPPGPGVYGALRAPWNLNPSPRVTRFWSFCGIEHPVLDWPQCSAHHNAVFSTSRLSDFLLHIQGKPHGMVHMMIGGVQGCNANATLDHQSLLGLKESVLAMWRAHLLEFPQSCAKEGCHYECQGGLDDVKFWNQAVFENHTFLTAVPGLKRLQTKNQRLDFVRAVCNSTLAWGDHSGAESVNDPSFWLLHGMLDRLYQYTRLVFASDIAHDPARAEAWNLDHVCKYTKVTSCLGHRPDDLTTFKTTKLSHEGYETKTLTNREILIAANPMEYRFDYVYDTFDWPHCDQNTFPEWNMTPSKRDRKLNSQMSIKHHRFCDNRNVYFADDRDGCGKRNSPVLGGVDVVAYRSLADPESPAIIGDAQFGVILESGFEFWFASEENRDTFISRPQSFAPRLGGFCALGLSGLDPKISNNISLDRLHTVPADPNIWWLSEDSDLFVFKGPTAKQLFVESLLAPVKQAEYAWRSLLNSSGCLADILFNTKCVVSSFF